jgi:hypothetical protein
MLRVDKVRSQKRRRIISLFRSIIFTFSSIFLASALPANSTKSRRDSFCLPYTMQLFRCERFFGKMLCLWPNQTIKTARICCRNHGIGMCSNLSITHANFFVFHGSLQPQNLIITSFITLCCIAQWQLTANPTHKALPFDTTMKNDRKTR